MGDPVFRSYFDQQPSRLARPVTVQQFQPKSSPKVVSVPVHFISSDQPRTTMSMLKESAALRIQRVFRGFLVRKSVKKIASIRNEVSEIERTIDDNEVVDLIGRDAKERLRVNETLMSLLFKLDSIRGVDCGVRDLRKAVTKKAIALQEKVDSIDQADHQTLDSAHIDSGEIDSDNVCRSSSEQAPETSGYRDEVVDHSGSLDAIEEEVVKEIVEICNPVEAVDASDVEENAEASPTEVEEDCNPVEAIAASGVVENVEASLTEVGKEDHTSVNGCMEVQKDEEGDGRDDDKRNRELLGKLMDDNEKMMKLMMQIFERNDMQTRMINSLSRRVEQLEKAFMCEKLRRKKKRHVA